jgi:RimJ/RimL family protein N-acetyltransferase
METFLETERIRLRRLTEHDVENLVELDSDPEVMRYLSGGVPTPREEIEQRTLPAMLRFYQRYPAFGYWAAEERSDGSFLGWFLLRPAPDRPADEIEIGYRLRRATWGRGLATEGSRALLARGFAEPEVRLIFAQTMTVNAASRRVMEKIGLRYVRTFHPQWPEPIPGAEQGEVEYALSRDEWRRAHRPESG